MHRSEINIRIFFINVKWYEGEILQMNFDTTNFNVSEQNGLRLITPTRETAVSNYVWTSDNLWLRSRIETLDGKTVSQGFGKFFNLGMGPIFLQTTVEHIADAITKQDVIATVKLDGSLLIRSVHEGKVMFRTRGSFGYDHLDNGWEVDQIFKQKYPKLFDPERGEELSLLFEWTTPNNPIVMKYSEPDLTLVGVVDHAIMKYCSMRVLEAMAKELGVPLVEWYPLDSKGLEDLMTRLTTEQRIEGWVVRIDNEQILVKIKCDPYLAKHRLKSNMTSDLLADLWFTQGRPNFQTFIKSFEEQYDEETAMWALPVISKLFDGVKTLDAIVTVIEEKVRDANKKGLSRKDFAISMLSQYGQTKKFSLAMNLWTGKTDNAELLKGILLQNTKQFELGMFKTMASEVE